MYPKIQIYMNIYEEIEIEDMRYHDGSFYYPCPCGDQFHIRYDDMLHHGEDIATCDGCTLVIRVIYDEKDLLRFAGSSWSSNQ